MNICDDCLEPYASEGDCSGYCQDCRDAREKQAWEDSLTEEQWVEYVKAKSRLFDPVRNDLINLFKRAS